MSKAEVGGWPDGAVSVQDFEPILFTLDIWDNGDLTLRWEDIVAVDGELWVAAGRCRAFPGAWIHVIRSSDRMGSGMVYLSSERRGAVVGRVLEQAGHPARPGLAGFRPGGVTEID